MVNFPNGFEVFNIIYTKDKTNKEIMIATTQIDSHNETKILNYDKNSNLFSQDRISGSINLINGNGTATFELKNLQYDEDGVFMLEIFRSEKLGMTVEVQGERKHFLFELPLLFLCIKSIMFIPNLKPVSAVLMISDDLRAFRRLKKAGGRGWKRGNNQKGGFL